MDGVLSEAEGEVPRSVGFDDGEGARGVWAIMVVVVVFVVKSRVEGKWMPCAGLSNGGVEVGVLAREDARPWCPAGDGVRVTVCSVVCRPEVSESMTSMVVVTDTGVPGSTVSRGLSWTAGSSEGAGGG